MYVYVYARYVVRCVNVSICAMPMLDVWCKLCVCVC